MCDCLPRRSVVLDKLRSGKKAISFKNNFACARATELAALAGFDCVWLCGEHVPMDNSEMEKTDSGGQGPQLRHHRSGSERFLQRFHPAARSRRNRNHDPSPHECGRGEGNRPENALSPPRPASRRRRQCRWTLLPSPPSRLSPIHERKPHDRRPDRGPGTARGTGGDLPGTGIDMIFFGPGDFSHALGIPGELDHPEVNRARRRIAETAHKHGKFAGTTCSMENMKAYFQLGYDFLNCGSDVSAMNDCCDRIMKLFRN